ncbi:MAG: hypothetical protein ACXAB7_04490 [Candidatus Kariarchaeaceae archaeon]
MKTSLFIGSLLFLLLPFSVLMVDPNVPVDGSINFNGFLYYYVDGPVEPEDNPTIFEPDWLAEDDLYGTSYFGKDAWVFGLIAMLLGIVALIAAIIDIHKLQGLLLVIAGVLTLYGRYVFFDDRGMSYPSDDDASGLSTWTDIPIGFIVALIFGLVSLRSSD